MTKLSGKFQFKVNGEEFSIDDPMPTADQILEIAKKGGAIPNDPEGYALDGEKGEYRGNERVDLEQDNIFITIPVGPTPVAFREIVRRG